MTEPMPYERREEIRGQLSRAFVNDHDFHPERPGWPGAVDHWAMAARDLLREVDRLAEELAALKDTRPCGRSATHPPHKWMSDRRAVQCAGFGEYETPAPPPVCGFELDDGSVAYYATGE